MARPCLNIRRGVGIPTIPRQRRADVEVELTSKRGREEKWEKGKEETERKKYIYIRDVPVGHHVQPIGARSQSWRNCCSRADGFNVAVAICVVLHELAVNTLKKEEERKMAKYLRNNNVCILKLQISQSFETTAYLAPCGGSRCSTFLLTSEVSRFAKTSLRCKTYIY